MFTPETGGKINKLIHFYAYDDMTHREDVRQEMMDRDKWLRFLDQSRPHVVAPEVSHAQTLLSTHATPVQPPDPTPFFSF
jgi:hypothetical protein